MDTFSRTQSPKDSLHVANGRTYRDLAVVKNTAWQRLKARAAGIPSEGLAADLNRFRFLLLQLLVSDSGYIALILVVACAFRMGSPPEPPVPHEGPMPSNERSQTPSTKIPKRRSAITAWGFEAAVLAGALGSFAAIIVILLIYNGQESPVWQYSINLNSLVAILSTILRAALMVPVAECMPLIDCNWS